MSILGHDLRNPLSTITMAANLQKRGILNSQQNIEMAEKIVKTAGRMQSLIEDLLDTTQTLGENKLSVEKKPADLRALCLNIIEEFRISHPSVKIVFYSEENCFGDWDERRIGQILANLISNAISYGDTKKPIKVNLTEDCDRVIIQVNNRGEIISDEAKKNIFTPFWRGSKKQNENSAGLGLGLYIVKRIVEAHDGKILVDSNNEYGTTFTVIFEKTEKESI